MRPGMAPLERLIQYFICSGAFDDFIDNKELSAAELEMISFSPEQFQPKRIEERLFQHCHLALRSYVRDRDKYNETARGLFRAQVDSAKQSGTALIAEEALLRITLEKGGYAVLLCASYLLHDASEAERSCWYRIGGIIQLTNDLFDIWKDLQDNVQTLPNRVHNAYAFHSFFTGLVEEMVTIITGLPMPEKRKRAFLLNMMAICSFGDMAIRQLCAIQGQLPELPDLRSLPRKALIVDMEKPGNIWHCMRFTWQKCRDGERRSVANQTIPA